MRVIGWFGRRNSGDEAFRIVHKLILPEVDLDWLVHGVGFTNPAALDDDLVLISAGDIVSPFYFDLIPETARIIVYGIGLGWEGQIEVLAAVRHRILAVWVRNSCDVEAIRALGIDTYYTPDIAFLLHRLKAPSDTPAPDRRKKAIVTVTDSPRADALRRNDCSRYLQVQNFAVQLAAALDYVAQYYTVEFVPFSFDRNDFDLAAIHDVIPRMAAHQAVHVIESEMTPLTAIEHFRSADLIISTKFHGVIYALLNHTPFIAVSDTRKVRLLCEETGFPELYLAPAEFHVAAFKRALTDAEQPETRGKIGKASDRLVGQAELEAERLRDVLLSARAS